MIDVLAIFDGGIATVQGDRYSDGEQRLALLIRNMNLVGTVRVRVAFPKEIPPLQQIRVAANHIWIQQRPAVYHIWLVARARDCRCW